MSTSVYGHSHRFFTVKIRWVYALRALMTLGFIFSGCQTPSTLDNSSISEESHEEENGETTTEPFWVDAEAGAAWNIFGLEIVGKVMSQQTNGQYAVVVSTTPADGGPPLHVHQHEDELFYVLEGVYEFRFGDETIVANRGDLVHLPRLIPHSFRNVGAEPGVMINTITPGGFEHFFVEIDQLPKDQPLDRQQVVDIAAGYGLQFLTNESE
ncbi:MAG: cupin domain-containing protein [Leptolyngbyaceae cyanobacterium MO_188.B28]|nr:cupin domain-containing protein [Leptolyngbyaceae cyanobacterium MO_188.B28]